MLLIALVYYILPSNILIIPKINHGQLYVLISTYICLYIRNLYIVYHCTYL